MALCCLWTVCSLVYFKKVGIILIFAFVGCLGNFQQILVYLNNINVNSERMMLIMMVIVVVVVVVVVRLLVMMMLMMMTIMMAVVWL